MVYEVMTLLRCNFLGCFSASLSFWPIFTTKVAGRVFTIQRLLLGNAAPFFLFFFTKSHVETWKWLLLCSLGVKVCFSGAKELTWRTRWNGTSASGLWRWRRTVRGNCAWSSRSRASRTPPVDTRTWIHRRDDSRTCRRSYTRRVYTCRTRRSPHSAHLLETEERSLFSISLMQSTAYSVEIWSPPNISSLCSYLPTDVIATAQFITLSHPWRVLIHSRLKYGFFGSICCSESSFTKIPLIINHADIRMYVLRPCIKHSLRNNSRNKGQSLVYGLCLGASYKLVQQFGHIWSEDRAGHNGEGAPGVKPGGNQRKVWFFYYTEPQSTFTPALLQIQFLELKFKCALDLYSLCAGAWACRIRSESKKHRQGAEFFINVQNMRRTFASVAAHQLPAQTGSSFQRYCLEPANGSSLLDISLFSEGELWDLFHCNTGNTRRTARPPPVINPIMAPDGPRLSWLELWPSKHRGASTCGLGR